MIKIFIKYSKQRIKRKRLKLKDSLNSKNKDKKKVKAFNRILEKSKQN